MPSLRPLPLGDVPMPPVRAEHAPTLRLHPIADPDRGRVERFIRRVYARHYAARIPRFAPMLASVAVEGRIVAAAGWRNARETLYLERYLDAPIESCIACRAGIVAPERCRIAEVGHLAAERAGEGRRLLLRLGEHLSAIGIDWVASTATPGVRAAFARIGVNGVELAPATRAAAGDDADAWGTYYERGATVFAGELRPTLARLSQRGRR